MNLKENVRVFTIAGCIFLLIYIFVAAIPLGEELSLSPVWTITVTDREALEENDTAETHGIPFKLGQNMGYFTEDGKISLLESFPFKAAISSTYRASFAADATNIPFHKYNPDSIASDTTESTSLTGTIDGSGFPFFVEDRIFLFTPGGFGLSQHNQDGSRRWTFESYTPIISFSSSVAGTAVGFTDGSIAVFMPDGTIKQMFEPGGSTHPIILGVAISNSGTQLACVSGIDRQRFVLCQEKNGLSRVVFHTYMEIDQREPVLVQFSGDESKVFYSRANGLGIVDCTTMENSLVSLSGKILSIHENPELNITCVLTKDRNEYSVYFIEGFDNLVGSFTFEANSAFITIENGSLYMGKNNTISRIDMERK